MRQLGTPLRTVAILPALWVLLGGNGLLGCRREQKPEATVESRLPAGHGTAAWTPKKLVIAVDVSLSMAGYFPAGHAGGADLDGLLDTLRELSGDHGVAVEPHALAGKGLKPWPEDVQSEAGRFFKSLKRGKNLFVAGNNDLVEGISALAKRVKDGGPDSLGLLFTDLVQSTPKEETDATGVGQALGKAGAEAANGGSGLGVNLVRVDLPFDGLYYPESPTGPGFRLSGVRRPFYLVVLSPTAATGARFVAQFCATWVQKTQDRKSVNLVSLSPDLTPFARVAASAPAGSAAKAFQWAAPAPSPWHPRLLRLSANRDADLTIAVTPGDLPGGVQAYVQEVLASGPLELGALPGVDQAPMSLGHPGPGGRCPLKIRATSSRREQRDSVATLRVPWPAEAAVRTPSWVKAISTSHDDRPGVLPREGGVVPTLNLQSIVETAQRRIGGKPTTVGYIELSKE